MAGTHFAGPVYAGGVPLLGSQGLMTQGTSWFVDPANGSDGNEGKSIDQAFATIGAAYTAATANQNDVIYYLAGSTANTSITTTLTWSKSYTHLVGIAAPTNIATRARVFMSASATTFTPMVNMSASGCIFKNLYFFHGIDDADAEICFQLSGGRNYFENVHFAGIGHATQGDDTSARSLLLTGSGCEENLFVGCTIGVDTVARSGANAELGILSSAHRNTFKDCLFLAYADNAGHFFITTSGSLDRWHIFDRCIFLNAIESAATTMTEAINAGHVSGGLLLKDCTLVGATDWENAASGLVMIDGAAPTNNTSGLAVDVA